MKSCFIRNLAEVPGHTFCSVEGQRCSFSGTRTVSYGAAGKFKTRAVTNGVDCSSTQFGDPYPGVPKSCYVK
jgi:hypothetical protein